MPLQWRNYIWQSLEEGAGKHARSVSPAHTPAVVLLKDLPSGKWGDGAFPGTADTAQPTPQPLLLLSLSLKDLSAEKRG